MPDERTEEDKQEAKNSNLEDILKDDFNQKILGAQYLKKNPEVFGKEGKNIGEAMYEQLMSHKKAENYAKEGKDLDEQLGMTQHASREYYTEKKVLEMYNESFKKLPLERLVKTIESVMGELELDIPDEAKNISMEDLMRKQVKGEEIEESDKYAGQITNYLQDVYQKYSAYDLLYKSMSPKNYVKSVKEQIKQINKQYASEESSE